MSIDSTLRVGVDEKRAKLIKSAAPEQCKFYLRPTGMSFLLLKSDIKIKSEGVGFKHAPYL